MLGRLQGCPRPQLLQALGGLLPSHSCHLRGPAAFPRTQAAERLPSTYRSIGILGVCEET